MVPEIMHLNSNLTKESHQKTWDFFENFISGVQYFDALGDKHWVCICSLY